MCSAQISAVCQIVRVSFLQQRPECRPDDLPLDLEPPVLIDRIINDGRYTLPAHFDVVAVGQAALLRHVPLYGVITIQRPVERVRRGARGTERTERKE